MVQIMGRVVQRKLVSHDTLCIKEKSRGHYIEMMDEDVFIEETLLQYEEDEEALLLLRDEALSSRLSKWRRPALSFVRKYWYLCF